MKPNASYIWRSLCEVRGVLGLGLRWRVGDGAHIQIWKDSWIPTNHYPRLLSPVQLLHENATVDALIDTDRMCWRYDLADQCFMPSEAMAIKQIPLSFRRPPDMCVWAGTKRGEFSVKSAYWLLIAQQCQVEASSSSTRDLHGFWTSVWSVKVPPKIKTFVWRVCRNILPTKTKLFERKLTSSYSCTWCMEEPETVDHVLWHCEFARKVWNACPIALPYLNVLGSSLLDFLATCLRELSSPEVEIVFATAWVLWRARNEVVWDGKVVKVDDICSRAVTIAMDSVSLRVAQVGPAIPVADSEVFHRWWPSEQGIYKVNVGIHDPAKGTQVGVGILVRDSMGEVVAASGSNSRAFQDNLITQAYAVLAALKLAYEIGVHSIYVEVDSKALIGMILKGPPCSAPCGVLIDDICSWIPLFSFLKFLHVKNDCNKAALALVSEAASSNFDFVSLEECHPCILSFVQFDLIQ